MIKLLQQNLDATRRLLVSHDQKRNRSERTFTWEEKRRRSSYDSNSKIFPEKKTSKTWIFQVQTIPKIEEQERKIEEEWGFLLIKNKRIHGRSNSTRWGTFAGTISVMANIPGTATNTLVVGKQEVVFKIDSRETIQARVPSTNITDAKASLEPIYKAAEKAFCK